MIYMFNPFTCDVIEKFTKHILSEISAGRVDSGSRIVYYNPSCEELYRQLVEFRVSEIQMPTGFHRALRIFLA